MVFLSYIHCFLFPFLFFHHSLSVYFIPFVQLTTFSHSLCQVSFPLPNSHSLYIFLSFPLSLSSFSLSNYSISNSLCQFCFPLPSSNGLSYVHFLFELTIYCLSLWHSLSVCVHGLSLLSLHDALRHGMMHCSMV